MKKTRKILRELSHRISNLAIFTALACRFSGSLALNISRKNFPVIGLPYPPKSINHKSTSQGYIRLKQPKKNPFKLKLRTGRSSMVSSNKFSRIRERAKKSSKSKINVTVVKQSGLLKPDLLEKSPFYMLSTKQEVSTKLEGIDSNDRSDPFQDPKLHHEDSNSRKRSQNQKEAYGKISQRGSFQDHESNKDLLKLGILRRRGDCLSFAASSHRSFTKKHDPERSRMMKTSDQFFKVQECSEFDPHKQCRERRAKVMERLSKCTSQQRIRMKKEKSCQSMLIGFSETFKKRSKRRLPGVSGGPGKTVYAVRNEREKVRLGNGSYYLTGVGKRGGSGVRGRGGRNKDFKGKNLGLKRKKRGLRHRSLYTVKDLKRKYQSEIIDLVAINNVNNSIDIGDKG